MKRVVFSKRSRTYRVTKTYYPAKKPKEDGYPTSKSIRPRKSPEKTKKEKQKARRDASDAAKGCKEDDRAIACLKLLGKWRRSEKHMAIYNQTSNEARREDQTGNWRIPSDEETEIDSSDEMPGEVPPEWDLVNARNSGTSLW